MDHPYCYPGTDVYRNKLDIRDNDALEKFERLESGNRMEMLPHDVRISADGYRDIHRYIFQNIYDWAGEYRTVTTGRTGPFCKAEFIDPEMDKRFEAINAEDNLRGLTPEQFAARAAEHACELNAIHPFLDGNGRTQRAFLQVLTEQAGHEIDLARIGSQAWNKASIESYHKLNYGPMRELIAGALVGRKEQAR
jgi:cell filamentation protein